MTETLIVIKRDHIGREVWRYPATVITRDARSLTVEARFGREDFDSTYIRWQKGDRMVETFFSDRWFNIFEIHDRHDDHLRGWYCNITRPAQIDADQVAADDLALDLFVHADGRMLVLDADEFAEQAIPDADRRAAEDGMALLMAMVRDRVAPFDAIITGSDSAV